MENYKEKYENLLHDIDIAIAGQKEGETKIVLQNIKERNTESEDERIRKSIIDLVEKQMPKSENKKWMIAWLEKQGEQSEYNPYKATVESIAAMVEKYARFDSDLQDFYNNVKVKCKDVVEYDKTFLEKQDEQPNKVSIWKHWNNGIAGNGEGKLIYLVKSGNTYSLASCLGFECDYIKLSELDSLMLEKQGEQKDTLCDKCKKAQPSHSCQDITELGRCAVEHEQKPTNKIEPKWKKE